MVMLIYVMLIYVDQVVILELEFHNDGMKYFGYLLNWFYSLWCQW